MIPFIIALGAAFIALYLYFNTQEEILKIAAGLVAIICLLSGLWFAPLVVKVFVVVTPFVTEKFQW